MGDIENTNTATASSALDVPKNFLLEKMKQQICERMDVMVKRERYGLLTRWVKKP